ncbi:unknown [Bacteroides eggerthii CAG:109]|uniref:Uncharacterized protein n=1 Tax=Bacteroides eggerthii TaxID=28111 RepID=A0A975Q7H3_9BACE|nr:hypothetical protein INE88_03305 [Bacteroides eggerthii]CCY56543.1 unknown [Bacteroides eggerthii CAG:109]
MQLSPSKEYCNKYICFKIHLFHPYEHVNLRIPRDSLQYKLYFFPCIPHSRSHILAIKLNANIPIFCCIST